MDQRTSKLLQEITKTAPVTDVALQRLEAACGEKLPSDYIEFLRFSNGGHGNVGPNSYIEFFSAEQIPALNAAARVDEFAPGLILFASNGMGTSYAFDTRRDSSIIEVDDMNLRLSAVIVRGQNFIEFLEYLFRAPAL